MNLTSTEIQFYPTTILSLRASTQVTGLKTEFCTNLALPKYPQPGLMEPPLPPGSGHQYADATASHSLTINHNDVKLIVVQSPKTAKMAIGKEKDRKPMDPPPVVQLKIPSDRNQDFMYSPHYFMTVTLVEAPEGGPAPTSLGAALSGTHVSSIHRLKDTNNEEGAFFIFGDLSIKVEGIWTLQFNLYQMKNGECVYITSCKSGSFEVQSHKGWVGMQESTPLTRQFAEQGVRLRLRKEPRTLLRKRGPASDNYEPRTYAKGQSQQSRASEPEISKDDGSIHGSNRSSQHSQAESVASVHTTISSLSHRPPQLGPRGFSQHSDFEEPSFKRSRTGSERMSPQSYGQAQYSSQRGSEQMSPQSFGQHQYAMESPQRMYQTEATFGMYNQPAAQPSYGGYYSQSPQTTNNPRDLPLDFARPAEGGGSSYGGHHQRPHMPLTIQTPSQFQQPLPYQQELTPTTTVRDSLTKLEVQSPLVPGIGGQSIYRQQSSPMYEAKLEQPQQITPSLYPPNTMSQQHHTIDPMMFRGIPPQQNFLPYPAFCSAEMTTAITSSMPTTMPGTTSGLGGEYFHHQ